MSDPAAIEFLAAAAMAGLAAGGMGDFVAEAPINEPFRTWVFNTFGENSPLAELVSCRYCVSAWAALFTGCFAYMAVNTHNPVLFLPMMLPAAWKIAVALRGMYE